ncbi:hypothetical protein SAMN00790413_00834 [Deinococcus hopiensis KR-140]|uniref:PEP-CTERM protein-sorting domain-containing protein n=1 Tax=Deinococcus hopiensis KR-140 TaxID=695939 RepID=A0A1W1VB27_9DEIO|nr:hypothetical protein SAMN00790413_00834 [Deinococcus hopiensis KR-140]
MESKPQAAPPPTSTPAVSPEYGVLSLLLLPIGLWWLGRAGKKKVRGE